MNLDAKFDIFFGLFACLFILISLFLNHRFNRLREKKITIQILISNLFQFKHDFKHPVTKIGLKLIFCRLFLMLCQIIINNSIKTSKLLIDTSPLIKSLDQLLKSDYTSCYFDDYFVFDHVINSPKTSLLKRVYSEKRWLQSAIKKEECVLNLSKMREQIDMTGKAFLLNPLMTNNILSNFMKAKSKGQKYWASI